MTTNIYIDGLNFYYGAVKGTPHKWIDFRALVDVLLPEDEIGQIKYFTARVKNHYPGDGANERQNVYLRALSAAGSVEIVLGHFRRDVRWKVLADNKFEPTDLFVPPFRPRRVFSWMWKDKVSRRSSEGSGARVLISEEKGSDVNLGVHLVHDALCGLCQKALVITNDSDLAQALVFARKGGISVGFMNPHPGPSNGLLSRSADFEIPFRREVLERCQLPREIRDQKGHLLTRPEEWS
jgi:hypothetical protein